MKKHIANIITGSRILFSVLMLFSQVFSVQFYIFYLLCGVSDLIDGTIARKTNSVSQFSSKFDSAADFIFAIIALIKLLPVMGIPTWLWAWILIIALIKVINIFWAIMSKKRIMVEHTIMNKITGLSLFVLPLTLPFIELNYSGGIVCVLATISAIQESYYIRSGKEIF